MSSDVISAVGSSAAETFAPRKPCGLAGGWWLVEEVSPGIFRI